MMKYLIAALLPLIAMGQESAGTIMSERQVAGLTAGLDTINDTMGSLTGNYASVEYTGTYCTNFIHNYIYGFLPAVLHTYTYPFHTNELTFAEGTTLTFDKVVTPHIIINDDLMAVSIKTTGTNHVSTGFYNGTYNIDNLNVDTMTWSGDVNAGTVTASSVVLSGHTLQSTGVTVNVLGSSGGVTYTTNDVVITGDVYIQAGGASANVYRNPLLQYDSGTGEYWYNPMYAMPSGDGSVLVTAAYPVEYRAYPLSPASGVHSLLSGWYVGSFLSGTGPRTMVPYPDTGGMVGTVVMSNAGPYLLSAYLLPAVDASTPFRIAIQPDPWVANSMPGWPGLTDVPPWDPPYLLPPAGSSTTTQPGQPREEKDAKFYGRPYNSQGADDNGSEVLSEPGTIPTWGTYLDTYGYDGAYTQVKGEADAWYGQGAQGSGPFKGPSYDYEYTGLRVRGPIDILIGVAPSVYSSGSYSAVTRTYERQMFTCYRVSASGSYLGLEKHYQQFTVTESKQVDYSHPFTFSYVLQPGWVGSHYKTQTILTSPQSVACAESELPSGARAIGDIPELFCFIGDTGYGFNNYGSTYRMGYSTNTVAEEYATVYLVTNGTSIYAPGVPDYLAQQFIYEPVGGTNRVSREMEALYSAGGWVLWQERSALYVQRYGSPVLKFLRHYDGSDIPAMDVSNTNFPFVVDSRGSPGESGFGNPDVAMLMITSQAEEVGSVTVTRDESTDAVSYTVYVKKRRPQW